MNTGGGTLPLRKPGTRVSRARRLAACASRFSTSVAGTSASTRTRDSGSSVTLVLTGEAIGGGERYRGGMPARRAPLTARLITGPVGFFVAGVLDVSVAWGRWALHEMRARLARRAGR